MTKKTRAICRLVLVPAGGLLFAQGCLARLEQSLDFVLAPDSLDSALFLPFSDVSRMLLWLVPFV